MDCREMCKLDLAKRASSIQGGWERTFNFKAVDDKY
jgi:hypothetical protein